MGRFSTVRDESATPEAVPSYGTLEAPGPLEH